MWALIIFDPPGAPGGISGAVALFGHSGPLRSPESQEEVLSYWSSGAAVNTSQNFIQHSIATFGFGWPVEGPG